MHGEAWVNTAIQEADLLHRARHALRRSRHRQPQDLRAERAEDPHRHRSGRDRQERRGRRRHRRRPARRARALLPASPPAERDGLAATHRRAQGRLRGPRHPEPARRRAPVCGARDPRHLARDRTARRSSSPTSASTRCGRRSTTTTTSRARSSPRAASARWASRCRRPSAPRWRCPDAEVWVVAGDGGFQMTMPRAGDDRAGEAGHQGRDHQQRLSRAWCGSGRSSSTSAATRRRRCSALTS